MLNNAKINGRPIVMECQKPTSDHGMKTAKTSLMSSAQLNQLVGTRKGITEMLRSNMSYWRVDAHYITLSRYF